MTRTIPAPVGDVGRRVQSLAARQPLVLIVLGVFFYSTGPVMVQASSVEAVIFSAWRLWFGIFIFGALTFFHFRVTHRRPRWAGWRYAVTAGVAFGFHQLFFMTAIKATAVVDVLLVGTLSPIVTGILAIPAFGERTGIRFRVWTLVAISGAAVVVLAGSSGAEGDPVGMTLAVLNVFAFAAFFLISKAGRDHIDVVPFLFGTMTVAAVLVTAYGLVASTDLLSAPGSDIALAFATAAVPGTLGHFVMTWPLRWVPANVPPLFRLGIPVISGLLAWWFLGEVIEGAHLLGGLVTMAGVAGAILSPAGRRLVAGERVAVD